jgi:hypothetical protein
LKAEVIERLSHFTVADNDHELWLLAWCRSRPKPHGGSALSTPIANDGKAAHFCKETNRTVQVAYRKCEMRPAH